MHKDNNWERIQLKIFTYKALYIISRRIKNILILYHVLATKIFLLKYYYHKNEIVLHVHTADLLKCSLSPCLWTQTNFKSSNQNMHVYIL